MILCILLTLRDIELPISPQSVGFGLFFVMGSLSKRIIITQAINHDKDDQDDVTTAGFSLI